MTKLPISEQFTDPNEVRRSAYLLFGCVLVLLSLGVVMVYSSTANVQAERALAAVRIEDPLESSLIDPPRVAEMPVERQYREARRPLYAHGLKVLLGLCLLLFAASIDYRRLAKPSRALYLVALLLLVLVLVPGFGTKINGARRWFHFDFLPFALQPSELAKLALILFLASWIAATPELSKSFRHGFLPGAAFVLAPAVLILVETDVGTFLLVSALGFSLLLLAGARISHLLLLGCAALPLLAFMIIKKLPYVVARFTSFQDPEPTSQVSYALSALNVGGLFGVGLGQSRTKLFYLAEAENDFILAVIGEELGFVGTTAVAAIFVLLIWSGGRILLGVRNKFGFFVVAGVLLVIATQALINFAVATASVPVKGMPLPFVSAGGSSLTVLCAGAGLILSVARHPDRSRLPLSAARPKRR